MAMIERDPDATEDAAASGALRLRSIVRSSTGRRNMRLVNLIAAAFDEPN